MKFVLLVYQGSTPVPGSDRWQTQSESEQKQIYADYANLNKTEGVTPGLPLGLPDAARTVQVRDGQIHVKNGTYLPEGAAGYAVYEGESLEAAIALAGRIPAARLGGAVEIRRPEILVINPSCQEHDMEAIRNRLHPVVLGEQNAVGGGGYVLPAGEPDSCRAPLERRSH